MTLGDEGHLSLTLAAPVEASSTSVTISRVKDERTTRSWGSPWTTTTSTHFNWLVAKNKEMFNCGSMWQAYTINEINVPNAFTHSPIIANTSPGYACYGQRICLPIVHAKFYGNKRSGPPWESDSWCFSSWRCSIPLHHVCANLQKW